MSPEPLSSLAQGIAAAGLDWIVPDWPAPRGVQALVTTRNGGISSGPRATMNLGGHAGDTDDALAENRRRLRGFLPAEPRWLWQVHGTVVAVQRAQRDSLPEVADAAITRERGVVCAVLVADCLPVLFANRHGTAVGAAHAGWRGLAAGVLERTVAAFNSLGVRPGDLVAWLGPAISPAAFEVGAEVRDAFLAHDRRADAHFARGAPGKWNADVYGLARQRLAECGVRKVGGGGFCSKTDTARFYSWRRDPACGRMAALVWLGPDAPAPHV
ncbi:MAG: peptidoglycan editing factor PgeF [Casimicrobiaceae bacterium]